MVLETVVAMEPPSIPDNRPHRSQAVSRMKGIIDAPVPAPFAKDRSRSNSPARQASKPPVFGQPAIERPPASPRRPSAQSHLPSPPLDPPHGFQNGINGSASPNGLLSPSSRRPSIGGDSVADSVATLDLGHHSIGQSQPPPPRLPSRSERRPSTSSHDFDQRSVSGLSLDQQSVGTQSLGHHSIGGPSGDFYS